MEVKEALPDHQRCNRTDGRSWRCSRPVKEGKKLCEIHYLQGLKRQHREKVPESLKIQRQCTKNKKTKIKDKDGLQIRAQKIDKSGKRSVKLKRRKLARELVRMVVKREVDKRKEAEEGPKEDVMRRLPNGIMVISHSAALPCRSSGNAAALTDVKVGVDSGFAPRRRFRSKNIEPLPIGSVQVLPFKRNGESVKKGGGRKKCHWCKKGDSGNLIKCSNCRKELYCMECIKERYFDTQEEVKKQCPVCRRTCRCNECVAGQSQATSCQELSGDQSRADRILSFHYLICMLLPVLKQIDQEQSVELKLEAKVKGLEISELQIRHDDFGSKPPSCNNCKTSIMDFHRSCSTCSYVLCVTCWWDFYRTFFPKGMNMLRNSCIKKRKCRNEKEISSEVPSSCPSLAYLKSCNCGGRISCPPSDFGGCGNGFFDLRCSFPLNWMEELETKAEEVICSYDYPEAFDSESCCSICDGAKFTAGFEHLQHAAMRKYPNENLLYRPSAMEVCADKREHFQKHWSRGHPVVVRDILREVSNLNWDPVYMFYTYLDGIIAKRDGNQGLPPCLEFCEVEISMKQYFWGPLRGRAHRNTGQEILKLKACLASRYFLEQFPDHYAQIIHQLPLQEYMNPESGILNLAANLQLETVSPELGPYIHISYSSEENRQDHCVSKLGYDLYDTVNILAHTTDDLISSENLNRIRKLIRKHRAESEGERESTSCDEESRGLEEMSADESLLHHKISRVSWVSPNEMPSSSFENGCITKEASQSCGAQWDIFRREDVPKLTEYFKRHTEAFANAFDLDKKVVHPILDQCYFLDEAHKTRLKEEFQIVPWTIKQHVGEAVVVPVGCPYQIRTLKSCVSVVLHFVSPESVRQCIYLMDEVRGLPNDHGAKLNKPEVKRMALNSLSTALKQIHELTSAKQV